MKVVKISDLRIAGYNPRCISDEALKGLTESIKRFGIVQHIVINGASNTVICGHQRVKALQAIGETEAQVVVVDLSESEEKALNITMNNPAIEGEFADNLIDLLDELKKEMPVEQWDGLLLDELEKEITMKLNIELSPEKEITEEGIKESSEKITCPFCNREFLK